MSSKNGMTSRERVLAAIHGQPVDRVPVMFWLNPHAICRLVSEIRPGPQPLANALARLAWRRFHRQGELDAGEWARALPLVLDEYGNQDYALSLGADIAIVSPAVASPSAFLTGLRRENGRLRVAGPLGATLGMGGIYAEVVEPAVHSLADLDAYQLPPLTDQVFAGVRRFRRAHPDACMLVEIITLMQALCGFILRMDDFFLALYDAPELIARTLARIADWVIEITRRAAAAGADVVQLADDYGTTGRSLIAPRMWRELVFPQLKRIADAAHECGVPLMLHSCGYQMDLLGDYVAAGIDVLQSFQPKAGNDFEAAYTHYGDHYAFATGIDTQQGEWMSPAELRADILQRYAIGRRKGRHILAMTHMMQYTMPPDNVRAILQTVAEIQAGLHD